MKKILPVIVFLLFMNVAAKAQNTADDLFNNGIKAQEQLTISSQNKAIEYFQKAKVCYDSESNKAKCDEQITKSKKLITSIQNKKRESENRDTENEAMRQKLAALEKKIFEDSIRADSMAQALKEIAKIDTLELSGTSIEFHAKGEEFVTISVTSNRDWSYRDVPEWIKVSKEENTSELHIFSTKNGTTEVRMGKFEVFAGEKSVIVQVYQAATGISKVTNIFKKKQGTIK